MFGQKGIPASAKVIFVADMFVEDYVGGAELTTESLITSSPLEVFKIHSKDVTLDILRQAADRFWVFGNFSGLDPQLIPSIVANIRYSIIEYDFKYCKARSPEKHASITNAPCDCDNQMNGKIISAFFHGAMGVWWMSESQKNHYFDKFPFLATGNNTVLSSVFDSKTLSNIKRLRQNAPTERKGWIVLGSKSWIKGFEDAEQWCKANGKEYEVVWDLPYDKLLEKLSRSEGFVYLPKGMDTCPRMVIEAKLLGCKLQLNESVQHKNEEWFADNSIEEIEEYLASATTTFWNGVKAMMDYRPSISGYTTTFNCVKQEYPFEQCIKSMLQFCDEVCIVDGGSTDGTWEKLIDMVMEEKGITLASLDDAERQSTLELCKAGAGSQSGRLRIKQVSRDWDHPRFAIFDGLQKAEARAMCTKEFCWQMDSDEIVHEADVPRLSEIARAMPRDSLIIALPVTEYWGGPDKVRLDVTPWKWRLSRNDPRITHGVPGDMRISISDEHGFPDYIAREGTDGCDMISVGDFQRIPFVTFYSDDVENLRRVALLGNSEALKNYQGWFNAVTSGLPGVVHYSWYDIPRKIRLYRDYWTKHWNSLYGKSLTDTAENNMMFDVPWSEVTDAMIDDLALRLKNNTGGWVWHRKWNGSSLPSILPSRPEPSVMKRIS